MLGRVSPRSPPHPTRIEKGPNFILVKFGLNELIVDATKVDTTTRPYESIVDISAWITKLKISDNIFSIPLFVTRLEV